MIGTRYNIGPCECPGTPHASVESPSMVIGDDEMATAGPLVRGDWAEFKDRLTFGDKRRISAALFLGEGYVQAVAIQRSVISWSLTDAEGKVRPISIEQIDDLSPEQADEIRRIADRPLFRRALPNATGGSSQDGSADSSTPTTSPAPTATSS